MSSLYIVTLLIYLYAEYIMWNAGLDEAQAGINIARRNINNLRYADDTILMADPGLLATNASSDIFVSLLPLINNVVVFF